MRFDITPRELRELAPSSPVVRCVVADLCRQALVEFTFRCDCGAEYEARGTPARYFEGPLGSGSPERFNCRKCFRPLG